MEETEKKPKYERDRLSLDNQIVKANSLIESRYTLSAFEQKLVLLLCSKISSIDEHFVEFPLTITEFCDFLGIDNKNYDMNKVIKKRCSMLAKKTFYVNKGTKTKPIWVWYPWFSNITLIPYQEKITFKFNVELEPYLLALQQQYTKYKLRICYKF